MYEILDLQGILFLLSNEERYMNPVAIEICMLTHVYANGNKPLKNVINTKDKL